MRETQLSPLTIVGYEDGCNLRNLSWNKRALEKVKNSYDLLHGEAVIFANTARTRFRLVASFYGMPMLILPPIDPLDRTSLYLKEAQYLRKFRIDNEDLVECLNAEIEMAEERIRNRKRIATRALRQRGE